MWNCSLRFKAVVRAAREVSEQVGKVGCLLG